MPAERYFIEQPFTHNQVLTITGTEFHHLAHVMRSKKGEGVELVNGTGGLAQGCIEQIAKDKALIKIETCQEQSQEDSPIILAQAMPKPNRLDFILEKGTELGVDEFWLFPGQLSVKKEFYPHQIERARQLTIAALKQCGRLHLPKIVLKPALNEWQLSNEVTAFFGDLEADAPSLQDALGRCSDKSSAFLFFTGPESGFTEKEIEFLKNMAVQGVKLHPNILRTDTASLVAVSLITHFLMDRINPLPMPLPVPLP